MAFPKKVVIAVDMNEITIQKLHQLKQMDVFGDAEVHFVHVFETISYNFDLTTMLYPSTDEFPKLELAVLGKLLQVKRDTLPHPHRNHAVLKCFFDTKPSEKICEYAKEMGADLMVVATQGKRGVAGFFDSSFTQYLCKFAPCSLLILR